MKKYLFIIILVGGCFIISSCSPPKPTIKKVREVDLASWVNAPIEALDLHSVFLTIPMIKTLTDKNIEIRIYANKRNISRCFGSTQANMNTYVSTAVFNQFKNCVSEIDGCDNIFYIKDGKVLEYVPVGNCYTDESSRPEKRLNYLLDS